MDPPERGQITLILGGARSGKSALAERLCEQDRARPVYIATAQAFDDEMRQRIASHRQDRANGWQTIEEALDVAQAIADQASAERILLVDCLTLWLSNVILAERDIDAETQDLVAALAAAAGPVVLVSNEVGLGIVPDNALARSFRDYAGRLHQQIAAMADSVYFVVAGIPMTVKTPQGGCPKID